MYGKIDVILVCSNKYKLHIQLVIIDFILFQMYDHKLTLEKNKITLERNKTIFHTDLERIASKLLKALKNHPENFDPKLLLKEDEKCLTSLLCEAVELNCPIIASIIGSAGGKTYTHGQAGKTALHHALDAKTGLEEMLLKHLGGSPFIKDRNGRLAISMMQENLKMEVETVRHL